MTRPHLPPMLAREAERTSSGGRASRVPSPHETSLPAKIEPEEAVERVLALLSKDQYLPARHLAAEAQDRFPDHPRVQWAWDIFENRGKARVASGGPEPMTDEEYEWLSEWLRNPPAWARGKWVALIEKEVVAAADTLKEVSQALRSKELSRRPLVHHID